MSFRPLLVVPFALGALALLPAAAPQTSAGAGLYRQRCQSCHAITPGTASPMGPSLLGVVGRKAGSAAYGYSPALKAAGIVWNKDNLDRYLAAPRKLVPGTRMLIAVPDAGQRAELIKYLETAR